MAIPKRLSHNTNGESQNENSEPVNGDDDVTKPVSIDEQLDAEFEEDSDFDGPTSFESELVGSQETVEPEEPESVKKDTISHDELKADRVTKTPRSETKTEKKRKRKPGEQPIEIDPKTKKLLPFGNSKKVLRTRDFEPRKNLRRDQTLARYGVLALVAGILLLGGYQAIFPAKPLTDQEVYNIALQATNYTNFPVESGRGFATDFMQAYLTVDDNSTSQSVLNYYYNGNLDSSAGSSSKSNSNRTATGSYNQTILSGPTVYTARGVTDTSGTYVVGALVQPKTVSNSDDTNSEAQDSEPRWMFFNVNVYYDESNQSFAITPESPSVVPAVSVKSPNDVPDPAPLGTGEESDELKADTESVVNGYIQGYMTSSDSDHSALDQYVVTDPDPSLTKGLNNEYALADSSNAITYEVYPIEESNQVKVRVHVMWVASPDGSAENESRAQFTSTYVMTLDRQSDGRYLVSKFAPEYYVADPEDG